MKRYSLKSYSLIDNDKRVFIMIGYNSYFGNFLATNCKFGIHIILW